MPESGRIHAVRLAPGRNQRHRGVLRPSRVDPRPIRCLKLVPKLTANPLTFIGRPSQASHGWRVRCPHCVIVARAAGKSSAPAMLPLHDSQAVALPDSGCGGRPVAKGSRRCTCDGRPVPLGRVTPAPNVKTSAHAATASCTRPGRPPGLTGAAGPAPAIAYGSDRDPCVCTRVPPTREHTRGSVGTIGFPDPTE